MQHHDDSLHGLICPQPDSQFPPQHCPEPEHHAGLGSVAVTFLPNIRQPSIFQTVDLKTALASITGDQYKAQVDTLRAAVGSPDYGNKKRKLPAFAFNGTFAERVANNHLAQSSGLFHFDIDGLSGDALAAAKATLCALPFTVFVFVSPSGQGLKGALRIDPATVQSDADFKVIFQSAKALLSGQGIAIDESCKDVRRLCFVSYDPDAYVNWYADVWTPAPPQPQATPDKAPLPVSDTVRDECLKRIAQLLNDAEDGGRHEARLKAGRLAGGYIAGGLLDEATVRGVLLELSAAIADGGQTSSASYSNSKKLRAFFRGNCC